MGRFIIETAKNSLYASIEVKFIHARGMDDTRHFSKYPDSETKSPAVKPTDDPFKAW